MKKKYFGTDGIRGKVGKEPITAEFMLRLGAAMGRVLARSGSGKVLIGKDTRISGYMFESALEAGLSASGIDIHLLGPMPTPAVAYLTRTFHAQAGIVISASHNPYFDNGIKFFSADGSKLPDEVELAIEMELDKPLTTVDSSKLGKAVRIEDAPGRYIEFCKSTIPASMHFRGWNIVVDCAHGATYHIAPNVLRELGANVIEIGIEPNGLNINDEVGSTHPQSLQQAVLDHSADFGIAFDGDGDRVVMVDHTGALLDGDEILYILARSRIEANLLVGPVIGTVMSNLGLEHALAALGAPFRRVAVGDRYVMEALKEFGGMLGGETSGHIICLDRTTTGDGIISALQVMAAMLKSDKSLYELKEGIRKYPQTMVNVVMDKKIDVLNLMPVQSAMRSAEHQLGSQGRILLRPSGTEPVVRVMVEGSDSDQVESIAIHLASVVKQAIAAAA